MNIRIKIEEALLLIFE